MRSRTAGLALLTAVTAASPAQGALEGPVQVLAGAGGRPDVLLRADGTALVSWESGTSVQVCRLPPGATACAGTATIAGPPGTTSRSRPFLLEGSSSRVLVVQGACCPQATQRFASTDGGALFGAGTDFASVVPADEGVIAGPGTQISLLGAPARYQLASSTGFGKTTQVVTLDTDAAIVGSRALALDPATGRPFATWGTAADAEAAGATSTTPSTAASWGAPGALAGTTGVRLAAGWATWVRGGRHEIARWTGAAFAEPVALANAERTPARPTSRSTRRATSTSSGAPRAAGASATPRPATAAPWAPRCCSAGTRMASVGSRSLRRAPPRGGSCSPARAAPGP